MRDDIRSFGRMGLSVTAFTSRGRTARLRSFSRQFQVWKANGFPGVNRRVGFRRTAAIHTRSTTYLFGGQREGSLAAGQNSVEN